MRVVIPFISLLIALNWGCATFKKAEPVSPLEMSNKAVKLQVIGQVGRKEVTQYYSHSLIQTIEEGQKTREKEEAVEFEVSVDYVKEDPAKGFIHTILTTLKKDGFVDLHDLAFPEVDERIEIVFKKNADVVYAGAYPQSSVFFVPPISLPDGDVKVGDTWEMERSWVNAKNNIPLHLKLVTILKNIYPCGGGQCADLEISGEVGIIATLNPNTNFESEIRGRILFSIDKGAPIWSLINSKETMIIEQNRVDVRSCLLGYLKTPKEDRWLGVGESKCDPKSQDVLYVPGTLAEATPH